LASTGNIYSFEILGYLNGLADLDRVVAVDKKTNIFEKFVDTSK
jgi:hypothetical protein